MSENSEKAAEQAEDRTVEQIEEKTAEQAETKATEQTEKTEKKVAKQVKKTGNIAKEILSYLEWGLLVISFGLVIYAFICTARGKAVTVFGYSLLHVVTGSMEPTISTGDYVIVRREEIPDLKKDDIVAYYTKDPEIYGSLVIHRIYEITEDGKYITKGDANLVADALPVEPDQVLGRYSRRAFIFNWIASFAEPRKLLLLMVVIPIFLISIFEVGTLTKLIKIKRTLIGNRKIETREETIERLKKEAVEAYLAGEKESNEQGEENKKEG